MKNIINVYPYGSQVNLHTISGSFMVTAICIRGPQVQYELAGPIESASRSSFWVNDVEVSGFSGPNEKNGKAVQVKGFTNGRS